MTIPRLNLILGGDFNSPEQSFVTDYLMRSQANGAGTAAVVTAPPNWGLGSGTGHGGKRDKFLMVDGATDASKICWGQDITLVQGQAYEFGVWVNANAGVALQLQVGGRDVGLAMVPGAGAGWQKMTVSFIAAESGVSRIALRDLSTDKNLNDFGLDDLSLSAVDLPMAAPDNLIVGGDFNSTFKTFSSDYALLGQAQGAGTAAVVTAPPAWGLGSRTGHGGKGDRFLMVDGATDASKAVWAQDVALVAGKTYEFSVWANSNAGTELQLQVGGLDVGSAATPVAGAGWQKLVVSFVATDTGTTRIALRDRATSPAHNDFGIDDLRLQVVDWVASDDGNLLVGSDFNSTNQAFVTQYALLDQAAGAGTAAVVAAPPAWGLGSIAGHGGKGDKFLMVDGATDANKVFWGQDVALQAGQYYEFSVWVNANAGVKLQLQVAGLDTGAPMIPTAGSGWCEQLVSFAAAETGTFRIALRDLATQAAHNDFGIDDVRLRLLPGPPVVNQLPTAESSTCAIDEDTVKVLTLEDFHFSDADAEDRLASVRITGLPEHGRLEVDSGHGWKPVVAAQDVAADVIAAGHLRFVPEPDAHGAAYARMRFTVSDGKNSSADEQAITFEVKPVNDAPTLSTVSPIKGLHSDAFRVIRHADLLSASDAADRDGDPLDFQIVTIDSGTLEKWNDAEAAWQAAVPGVTRLSAGEMLRWKEASAVAVDADAFKVMAWDGAASSAVPRQVSVRIAGGFVIDAPYSFNESGISVAAAGDVNGDGLDDLIVAGSWRRGEAHVVFGKADAVAIGLDAVGENVGGYLIRGSENTALINSVAGAGDLDGDGLADVIIAMPGANEAAGQTFVVLGKAHGGEINLEQVAAGIGGYVINGQHAWDESGTSVKQAGDVNGDGLLDLIIGAKRADGWKGRAYVVFGKTDGQAVDLDDVAAGVGGFAIQGSSSFGFLGTSVSGAGDVNGDGLADLIVGEPGANGSSGMSYVVFGRAGGSPVHLANLAPGASRAEGFAIRPTSLAGALDGASVSAAGDVNGDGLADLLVGVPKGRSGFGDKFSTSFVVFGKTNGRDVFLDSVAGGKGGFAINAESGGDDTGYAVSAAGDVNGDGLADLIVGAMSADHQTGKTYVVYGKAESAAVELAAVATGKGGFVVHGESEGDGFGGAVSAAGDVNGDGLADLIVGASGYKQGDGRSYVIFGSTSGLVPSTAVDQLGTAGDDKLVGTSASESLIGCAGNDTLWGRGGADVMYGGVGDDTFVIDADNIAKLALAVIDGKRARIDGGSGIDTVQLDGAGLTLDLTKIANVAAGDVQVAARLQGVDRIDLTGSGDNVLKLEARDVLEMSRMNAFNAGNGWTGLANSVAMHQLIVQGDAGDALQLAGSGWTRAPDDAFHDGQGFHLYTSGLAQLLVSTQIAAPILA